MTTVFNVTALLKVLGFSLEEGSVNSWTKIYYNHNNYKIKIDFQEENIDYGKKIIIGGKTTCNFKSNENFVVLECVDRLLEKGYQPRNIRLEETWATGHGTSGRLDILITRDNGSAYLMIECKTYGAEFDKEFKRVLKDGGQLFTYFQQDKNADMLMLYASELDKKGKIQYRNEIVKIEDDYRQTGNVKDFYDRWNKLPKNNGVLDPWVNAYDFQSKALTPKGLKDITQSDSSFIFNQFLEILRHNVVSDKPNAFNKIFTLFLCKIYDEKATKPNEELAFQWFYTPYQYEGVNYPPDDNVSFQKRLTDLYKKGMNAFLDKDVTDISDADFERKYGSSISSDVKRLILNDIVEIRLKKNNEFAIKEVFNDDSFNENAKAVKEVVELLQGYKIRYTKKQQYLSDFFELLLTTGLKQESGQFFTPVPIAQFIIKSIPLDKIVADKLNKGEKDNLLPAVIDYAAGSGHFITETMHEMQRIIDRTSSEDFIDSTAKKIANWKTDHFDWALQYVYGIEKDYRLVKVGKVGCYLHGDGLAQIIHSDGLGNFSKTEEYKGLLKKSDKDFPRENKQFDIVVSNPPYSVSAFKNNARKYYTEDDFEIYDKLTDQSSEIECLFIERTKQLLKDGGIAGIILPSSILSNTGIYTKAREIILQHFDIIAIAELGSNTFMATGTNTGTLFLRRRNNYVSINIKAAVEKVFSNQKDVTLNQIEKPIHKYVAHIWEGITFDDYVTLLQKQPNEVIKSHEIYLEYQKKINSKNDADKWNKLLTIEQEKFFYFVLAYPQELVLVKSGEKTKEKQFLGYEFSNRRGSEGIHPLQRGKGIDECTQLFDSEIFNNPEKASTYIYKAFNGDFKADISSNLQNHVVRTKLIDMLSFDRGDFEKTISLIVKKKPFLLNKWPNRKLGDVSTIIKGVTYSKNDQTSRITKKVILTADNITLSGGFELNKQIHLNEEFPINDTKRLKENDIFICFSSGSKDHLGKVALIKEDTTYYAGGFMGIIRANKGIESTYIYELLNRLYRQDIKDIGSGANINNLSGLINDVKIPIPPHNIQKEIVIKIKELDALDEHLKKQIESLQTSINDMMQEYKNASKEKIENLAIMLKRGKSAKYGTSNIQIIKSGQARGFKQFDFSQKHFVETGFILDDRQLQKGDILINSSGVGTAGRVTLFDLDGTFVVDSHITILRLNKTKALPDFILQSLASIGFKNIEAMATGQSGQIELSLTTIQNIKIALPSIGEQNEMINKIILIEAKIEQLQAIIDDIPKQKELI